MLLILLSSRSKAEEIQPVLTKGHATAYCLQGTMANGEEVHTGACALNSKVVKEGDLMGKTLILYQRLPGDNVGKVLGYFIICDTGCKKGVVDVWLPDLNQCQEFMNLVYEDGCKGKIFYQIVEAEG